MTEASDTGSHPVCRICGGAGGAIFQIREMMFGLRLEFPYFQCTDCDCIQILNYPDDMGAYYGDNYYSLEEIEFGSSTNISLLRQTLINALYKIFPMLWRKSLQTPHSLRWIAGRYPIEIYLKYLRSPNAKILDIGAGSGTLVKRLRQIFFSNAIGIDPFLKSDVEFNGKILVKKIDIDTFKEETPLPFDFISLNHVLEHMPNQRHVMSALLKLCHDQTYVMIRIPQCTSHAWEKYRTDWFQLDAPRHFYIHSRKSLEYLAVQAGFEIVDIQYDSEVSQILFSEGYRRNIDLQQTTKDIEANGRPPFEFDMAAAQALTDELNRNQLGDQFCVILRKSNHHHRPNP